MRGDDLAAEFAAAMRAMRQSHFDRLRALGVDGAALVAVGQVGTLEIATDGRLFAPSPQGDPALVLAAWDRPPLRTDGLADPLARPVDLVAFKTAEPRRWWSRRGVVSVLGEWLILGAMLGADPVRVYRTPLDWLRSGGDGLVALDSHGSVALASLPGLIADDTTHGEELRRALERPHKAPPIYVQASTVGVAA